MLAHALTEEPTKEAQSYFVRKCIVASSREHAGHPRSGRDDRGSIYVRRHAEDRACRCALEFGSTELRVEPSVSAVPAPVIPACQAAAGHDRVCDEIRYIKRACTGLPHSPDPLVVLE